MKIKKYRGYAVSALAISLGILGYWFWSQKNVSFEDKIDQLNKKMTYLEISHSPYLAIENQKISDLYIITIRKEHQKDAYFFDKYEYTKTTGKSLTGVSGKEICSLVDSLQTSDNKIIEGLKKTKISLDLSVVKIDNIQGPLADIWFLFANIIKNYKVDIYIKGFADGYEKCWVRSLESRPYKYNSIEYLPTLDLGSHNPNNYSNRSAIYHINNGTYENKDLPNLRAMFIREDIIKKINECSGKVRNVQILEGFEFKKRDSLKRTVEIYIKEIKE